MSPSVASSDEDSPICNEQVTGARGNGDGEEDEDSRLISNEQDVGIDDLGEAGDSAYLVSHLLTVNGDPVTHLNREASPRGDVFAFVNGNIANKTYFSQFSQGISLEEFNGSFHVLRYNTSCGDLGTIVELHIKFE